MSEPIPESWPVEEAPALEVPVFPLKDLWLFPYVVLPLHVFEPRYRQMVEDSLDGPGRIVVATVREDWEGDMSGSPPIYPVGGLGEIGRHERLDDGRFHVWLFGLGRVRIQEVESDRLYRKVRARPLEEIEVPLTRQDDLRKQLLEAVLVRTHGAAPIPPHIPIHHLVDLLLMRLRPSGEEMLRVYAEPDREKRANLALEMHEVEPVPPPPEPEEDGAADEAPEDDASLD